MIQQDLTIALSLWASILSTALAGIKIWEKWQERMRLTTSYSLSHPDHGGNEVIIENPSNAPVMINYWELLWIRGFWKHEITDGRYPNEGYCAITIAAHGRHTLHFDEDQYFSWGRDCIPKGKLYLRLHIVGRNRRALLKVYDPAK